MKRGGIVVLLSLVAPFVAAAEPAKLSDWADHPLNQWVRQSPREGQPAPAFGWEGSGCYDPWSRRWIHFGGHDGIPQGFALFAFDLATGAWEQRFPSTSPAGVCCVDGAATFDVAQRRFVRFPGASLGHGFQWSRGVKLKNSHVWLYDPAANSWMNMRPAPYRPFLAREGLGTLDAAATYDPHHELSLSFGGQDSSGGMNNFAYDAFANQLYRMPRKSAVTATAWGSLTRQGRLSGDVRQPVRQRRTNLGLSLRHRPLGRAPHRPAPRWEKARNLFDDSQDGLRSASRVCLCVTWDTNNGKHETWVFDSRWTK